MKLVLLVALLAVCVSSVNVTPNPALEQFLQYMTIYKKSYQDENEFQMRFQNFQNSLARINARNGESNTAFYDVTKFSDMSVEEFRSYPCGVDKLSELTSRRPDFQINMADLPPVDPHALPASWDWTTKGAVTHVKNQGQCGSCWAFSTIGNMEGVWFVAGHNLTSLSEEQIVDCSTTDYGCDGGFPYWAMADMDAAPYDGGIETEKAYPYTAGGGESGSCKFKHSAVAATEPSYTNYCNEQTSPCTMAQIQQLLVSTGPLSACLNAESMQDYTSGIDHPSSDACDPDSIDHCITLVGYGTTNGTPYWKIKNSWGTDWGESGYYYLYRDDSSHNEGVCGINRIITVASVNTH